MERSALTAAGYEGYRVSTRLVRERAGDSEPRTIRSASDVFDFFSPLAEFDREHFYTVHLDAKSRVIGCDEVSRGTLDSAPVHPREVYKAAILGSAASIIAVHNHPSGDPRPSREDRSITDRLARAGTLLGIPLLDHVIIGDGRYYSMNEMSGM